MHAGERERDSARAVGPRGTRGACATTTRTSHTKEIDNMKLTKSLGMLLLGIWLILTGLIELLSFSFPGSSLSPLSCLPPLGLRIRRVFHFPKPREHSPGSPHPGLVPIHRNCPAPGIHLRPGHPSPALTAIPRRQASPAALRGRCDLHQ